MTTLEVDSFRSLIKNFGNTTHGSVALKSVREYLGNLGKSARREECLSAILFQEPIQWESVKDRIWANDEAKQDANRFDFLQGDIVDTTMVLAPGIADSEQTHSLWLVLSPDCDAVRATYVSVAPVFEITTELKSWYATALKLGSHRFFPIPFIIGDAPKKNYFADLTKPYFIHESGKKFAIPIASLQVDGWHLLNALVQEKETRSVDIQEAVKIRTLQ